MNEKATKNDWPLDVEWGLIGSCTNSSYEDLSRAASIAKQAVDKGLVSKLNLVLIQGLKLLDIQRKRWYFRHLRKLEC